jgi:hypothetical protein
MELHVICLIPHEPFTICMFFYQIIVKHASMWYFINAPLVFSARVIYSFQQIPINGHQTVPVLDAQRSKVEEGEQDDHSLVRGTCYPCTVPGWSFWNVIHFERKLHNYYTGGTDALRSSNMKELYFACIPPFMNVYVTNGFFSFFQVNSYRCIVFSKIRYTCIC